MKLKAYICDLVVYGKCALKTVHIIVSGLGDSTTIKSYVLTFTTAEGPGFGGCAPDKRKKKRIASNPVGLHHIRHNKETYTKGVIPIAKRELLL